MEIWESLVIEYLRKCAPLGFLIKKMSVSYTLLTVYSVVLQEGLCQNLNIIIFSLSLLFLERRSRRVRHWRSRKDQELRARALHVENARVRGGQIRFQQTSFSAAVFYSALSCRPRAGGATRAWKSRAREWVPLKSTNVCGGIGQDVSGLWDYALGRGKNLRALS